MKKTVLEVKGLTKKYGDLTAVDNLDLEIKKGEVFGFLGPNGAGKTTTISMMCGLVRPDKGTVLINGYNISKEINIRSLVGICPQQIIVWKEMGCLEQLVFMGAMYNLPRRKVLVNSKKLLKDLMLENKAKKRAGTLSGGMQRRLNIALALVHDPEIIVLDEPEAGLDPQNRVLVREFIKKLAITHTVIVTTHNMDEADRVADRIAIIDRGKLLVVDDPEALKERMGPGDVLELIFNQEKKENLKEISILLKEYADKVSLSIDRINLHALNLTDNISDIMNCLNKKNIEPSNVRLRKNSLEDVFISLTGRGLRE